jgi:hypothetical protein
MSGTPKRAGGSGERMATLLDQLELTPLQKEMLRQRWLEQVTWLSGQARRARTRHYIYRLPVVVGGVMIPALISITLIAASNSTGTIPWLPFMTFETLRGFTFVVSVVVAVLAALEEVFNYGERWRHYRRTTERLKSFGWQFLMLNGAFRHYKSHADAFTAFTERVEETLNEDVEGYLDGLAGQTGERARHEVIA